jgi:predicted secreted protein
MRRTLTGLVALLGSAGLASAGDYADREIIGFSPDGATFAFEEYGVEDGSGFPYSNIFVVDVATDDWVPGTPIRLRDENESRPLSDLRREAREKASAPLGQHSIAVPGTLVASNPATETSADPYRVTFLPRLIVPPSGAGMNLELAEAEMPAADCPDFGKPFKGFQITLTGTGGPKILHADTQIPKSRRCPIGYAISDVVTLYPDGGGDPAMAVIVSVYSVGFEGPDRRFLAVTTRFKE